MTARRPSRRTGGSPLPWVIAGAVVLVFVAMVAALARRPEAVRVGDHWHARLAIVVCGQTLPPLPPGPGDVHTHGDGVIHIHPETAASAGRNATLGAFFQTTPLRLTPTSLTIPGERTHANGDACPDGRPGTLRVLVRRDGEAAFRPEPRFLRYLPRDGDEIRVVFGP